MATSNYCYVQKNPKKLSKPVGICNAVSPNSFLTNSVAKKEKPKKLNTNMRPCNILIYRSRVDKLLGVYRQKFFGMPQPNVPQRA